MPRTCRVPSSRSLPADPTQASRKPNGLRHRSARGETLATDRMTRGSGRHAAATGYERVRQARTATSRITARGSDRGTSSIGIHAARSVVPPTSRVPRCRSHVRSRRSARTCRDAAAAARLRWCRSEWPRGRQARPCSRSLPEPRVRPPPRGTPRTRRHRLVASSPARYGHRRYQDSRIRPSPSTTTAYAARRRSYSVKSTCGF